MSSPAQHCIRGFWFGLLYLSASFILYYLLLIIFTFSHIYLPNRNQQCECDFLKRFAATFTFFFALLFRLCSNSLTSGRTWDREEASVSLSFEERIKEIMNYDWKRAVKKADKGGAGSSGQLSGYHNIEFRRQGNNWIFTDENNNVTNITTWKEIPVETIHFKKIDEARYAKLNSRDEAVVQELTKSIMRGDVKIVGQHACVNNIGNAPVPDCPEIVADVPVPIRRREDPIYAKISKTRVTRGTSAWYIHTAYIEESTGPGNGRTIMEPGRIYMCGGQTRAKLQRGMT